MYSAMKKCLELLRCLCAHIKNWICEDRERLKEFKKDWAGNIALCCSWLACAAAVIGFFVLYVMYIVQGGYPAQVQALKDGGMEGSFTGGTAVLMYRSFLGYLLYTLLILSAIFTAIEIFVTASVFRKIFMGIDLFLFALSIGSISFMAIYLDAPRSPWRDKVDLQMLGIMTRFGVQDYGTLINNILFIALFVFLAAFILFVIVSKKRTLSRIFVAAVISLGALPLLLLLLENLLFIGFAIIYAALFVAVLWYIGQAMMSGSQEVGNNGGSSGGASGSHLTGKEKRAEQKDIRIIQVPAGQKLYIDERYGGGAPMTKCVFTDTATLNHKYLCTLKDLQTGNVKIMQGGKEIHVS